MRASPTFDVGKKLKSNKTMYSDLSIFQSKFKEMKLIKLMNSSVRVLLIFLVLMYSKEAISQTITYDPAPTGGVISICHGGVLTVTVNGTVSGEEYILNVNPPYGVETLMANGSSLTFTPVSYADLGQFGISVIRTTAPVIFFPNQTINVVADPTAPTLTLSNPEGSVNAGTMISATLATAGSGGVTGSVDDYEYSIDGGMTWLDYTLGNNISTTGYMMPPVKIKAFRAHPDGLGCYAETIYTWTVFSRVHDITGDQGSYYDIQQAIDAPNTVEGDVIKLDAGTIALLSVVNVNKAITLQGNGINNTIVELSSSWFNTAGGYAFTLNAEGITVNDIHFKIVGKGQGNILYISKSNTTIEDNKFSGEYVNGDGEVTRAAVWSASPLTGLAFNNNIIESLRQPGYINNGSGTISNNTITNTRGWVIAGTGTLSMTGNTFNNNTSHITVLEDSNISGLSISNNDLSGMVNDWRIDNRAGVLQATCNWFGSADYTTIDSKNKGKVVFVPYKTSLIGACDGTNAIPANLELVYSASGENVQLKFDVTDNDMQLRIIDIPGYVPTDPGYLPLVAALYATLKAATDPDDIQAAALAVGDDILAEYYYFDNYNNKVYLKTINNNELVKNKYWDKYLVRTTDLVRFPDWANGITLVEPARYSTSTNPSTGAVASGWLNPVLGRDLYVDVTFIHNGTVTTETKTVAIGAGPIKNLDTGLGFATIQEAIDSSSSGDRIGIAAGTYTGDVNGTGKTVTLVPGNSPGCVTINGNLTLVSTNTLEMEVEGTTACTEYDQFIVNGTVSLGGAILDLNLGMSYTPTVGDSYTFIANNDTDAITGQFAQGSTISKSGHVFTIDYDGGDGNDVVLTNCAGGIVNNNTGNGYCSIQDAIDAATAGDVIEITAASITEGQIVIDKSLTIQGLGSSLTKVFSSYVTTGSGHSNPTTAWIRTEPGTNVNIKDLSLDGNSNSTIVALRFQSGGSVDGVAFNDIKSGAYLGTAVQVLNGEVNIENSTFTNIGRIGAHFRNGVIVNADISGSFINNIYTGKGVGDWLDYALDISGGVGPLSVEGNRITNNKGVASTDGSTSAGILVSTYFPLPNNSVPNNVTIQGNSLSNNYAGVAVGYNAGDMSVVSITGNDIFDNDYGVTTTGPEVDATNNYWGAPDGPSGEGSGSGDEIDAGINACPFYDGPVATGTLTNCRVVVYQGTSTTVRSSHMNIQDAIDESTTANGDVITVAAGTYAENVTVNKALDIRGPKYNVAGNGLGRGAGEAIVVPAVSGITWTNDAIFKVTASDVSINGFTIDGDNPLITTGYSSTTTADIDAGLGVSVGGTGINNLKVSNNIIQNLTLFAVYGESTNTTGHLVQNNLIRDLGTYDTTSGVPYWGGGVYIGNKTYANILDNVMENVRIGVQTGQFGAVEPAPQLSHNISGNIIQARKRGIFFNEHYNGTPFVVSNNNISALQNAIETSWNGMLIAGQWNNSSTFTNNIIDGSGKTTGTSKGIEVWRVKEIAQPLISGGTISNVDIGLYLNNFEGDNNNNDAPQGTFATASEMTISPNTGGVGIRILDSNSSTHGPVQITLGTNMIVNGGANGLVLENASAKVISPLGNLALNSQTSKYIKLIGNANDIDATSVLFDAKLGSAMTDTELFATEDKIDHKIDLATLGLVTVKSNSFYVTTNSFVSPNTSPLIQRAIDAASNGDVIAVDAGTYAENVLVNKSLELYGAGEGVTTIIPSFVGAAPPSCPGSDCTGASNVIKIAANNVHLHDFSIDGNNPALTSGIVISGVDIDARNGIISDGSSGRSNLEINKVTVSNIYLRAIYPQFTTNMNVHHNTVSNVRGPSGSIAIMSWASSGTMSNNTVFDVNDAIVANHSLGITFSNNTVTNSDSGIHSDNNGSGGGATADVITGNTISNGSGSNSWGIFVYVPYKNTVVSDNTITNVHVGITTTGALGTTNPTVTISGNTIDGQSLSGSTGAYITTSTFGYADGNNNTIFTNNFITNTDQLMELEAKTGFTNNFVANDNSFTNNNVGIVKSGGGTITENLTCNWWGSTASGDVMAAVGAGTNYAPWLTSGMDDSSDAGFQPEEFACSGNPVVIDNMTSQPQTCATGGTITVDFSGGTAPYGIAWTGGSASDVTSSYTITGLTAGSYGVTVTDANMSTDNSTITVINNPVLNVTSGNTYATIQAAIDAATVGQVIEVCKGTYNEEVVIDKAITLNGAKQGVDPRPSVASSRTIDGLDESIIVAPKNKKVIDIQADNVIINGFQITQTGGSGAADAVKASSSQSNIEFKYNIVANVTDEGIQLEAGINNTIHNNYIFSPAGDGITISSYDVSPLKGTNQKILDNDISGSTSPYGSIYLYGTQNVEVARNIINTKSSGISIGSGGLPVSSVDIHHNEINTELRTAYSAYAIGIGIDDSGDNIMIHNNKVVQVGTYSPPANNDRYNLVRVGLANTSNPTNVSINDNYLERFDNENYVYVIPAVTTPVNAECNWWNSTNAQVIESYITSPAGIVDYSPWLTSGNDDNGSAAGFEPEDGACNGSIIEITAAATDQLCGGTGSILVTWTGGTAPYDIAWTGGSASGVTSPYDITGLPAGSYNVTITDTYGSTATELVNILYLPVTNTTAATHHVSIQAAINAASQGDEIVVCDGTYAENVVIDKALHISSLNGSDFTTIEPVSGYPVAINAHVGGPFEDVSMDGFTINSHGAIALISYSGTNDGYNVDGLILNDLVVDANGQYGLALFDVNNALIDNVTITNANTGMEMIGMANLSIDHSSITGSTGKAINLSKSAGYEKNMNVSITNSSITGGTTNVIAIDMKSVTGTLTLDENEISNNTGFGFRIDNTPTDDALALNITNNNFFANGGVAVYIEDDNSLDQITANINNNIFDGNRKALGVQEILSLNVTANIFRNSTQNAVEIFSNNVKLNNNSFVGNTGIYALLATVPTNAQYNWWGDASGPSDFGPGSGQPVSDNVNYCPWLNGIPAVLGGSGAPVPVEVINTTSGKVFCSIQDAINDIDTHNGDIITASPGVYKENVTVNKEVDIRGPKYNIAGNGSGRGTGEAIVMPNSIATVEGGGIFMVKVSNVSINGFTIDGDNTALTSGRIGTNGADIDALEGVTIYDATPVVNNLVVSNNIIQNLAYFGVTLFGASNYSDANTSKTGHEISNNLIRNMGHYNTGNGYDKWGGGVLLYNSHYAHVANNTMTNVRIGVQTGNFQTAHTGLDPTYRKIENNTIEARAVGIFYNLQNYTPFSIEDNTITGIYDADEEAGATRAWKGISIASLSSNMGPSDIIGNNIDGTGLTYSRGLEGINVWNVNSNSPANISGGTITNVNTGIFVNNFEGYSSNATNGAHATISGVTINASEVGVRVLDSPSSTTHAKVNATVTNTTINAGTDGIKVEQTDNSGAQAGGVFTENTINATTSGINIARSTTSTTNPLTISDNDITLSSQLAGGVPTTGIVLNNVNGTAAATVSDNTITNPFFGYGIYNLNTSPASTITGDTITGILQGVASVNTLDNTNFAPSVFNLSGMTMSGFTGDHPSLSAINFHAGVYAFTGGADGSSSITSTISDMDISGTGKIAADCAGLAFADFSTAATTMQNITINASNIHDNLNRGIHARGSNTVVTVNTSTISNNGYDAFGTGGNIGFSIVALKDATVNANNNFITLPANGNKVYGLSTGNGSANQIIAHNNSILRNGNTNPASKLAQATGTNSIDATCNWWGTTVCPADEVSGDVTVYPFITNGTDDNVAPGFQPVAGSCAEPSITATVTGPGGSIIMDSGNDYDMTICSGQEVTTSPPAVINIEAANCASLRVQTVYTTTISTLPPTQTVDLAYAMASIAPPTTISPENHDGVAKDIVFVSTPYYDVNGNGAFDAGDDVAGGTITFTLTVEPLPIVSNTVTSGAYSQVMTSGGSYTHSICHDTDITTSIPSIVSDPVSSCGVLRMNTQYISTLPNIPSATLDETFANIVLAGPQTISPNNTTGSPQTITFITTAYYDLDGSESLTAGDIVGDVTNFVLTIHPIPTAAISGTATVEQFDPITPVITFTGAGGTQPYTFTYNINGGANQTVTTPTGLNSTTVAHDNSVLGVFTYNLVSAVDGNGCSATILTDPPLAVIQVVLPGDFVELAPFIARPDNVIFGLGESKDGYVQFKNGGAASTAGPVTFRVYKPANFTLTLSNTISQITPSGESTPVAVSNSSPDWTITWKPGSGGYYEIYSNVTGVIGGLSNVKFGFTLEASSSFTKGVMKVDIIDASGGDKNKYNNVTNKGFNIN